MNLDYEIKKLIKIHKELHGKDIVDYAIRDDVMRKTKTTFSKEIILAKVQMHLKELDGKDNSN